MAAEELRNFLKQHQVKCKEEESLQRCVHAETLSTYLTGSPIGSAGVNIEQ
jgi:hypothetical protein